MAYKVPVTKLKIGDTGYISCFDVEKSKEGNFFIPTDSPFSSTRQRIDDVTITRLGPSETDYVIGDDDKGSGFAYWLEAELDTEENLELRGYHRVRVWEELETRKERLIKAMNEAAEREDFKKAEELRRAIAGCNDFE